MAKRPVAIEDIAMLTMLLPTRIVIRSRWGSDFSSWTTRAPCTSSSTSDSTRWRASENIAISEEEKNADSAIRNRMATAPAIVMVVSVSGTTSVICAKLPTPAALAVGDKPMEVLTLITDLN